MSTGIKELAASIKAARKAKSLTQKELGERVGLPQSHISKIEGGGVDLQLSSLIEIARALSLELKLVPRKALPAIDGVVRTHSQTSETSRALATIAETNRFAEQIRTSFPAITQTRELQDALRTFRSVQIEPGTLKAIQDALQPVAHIREHLQDLGWALETQGGAKKLAKQIEEATRSLNHVKNLQIHSLSTEQTPRLPAYRLEEDEA